MANKEAKNNIKFKYIFSENYNPVYCNGAFGGVSPQGEIVANFFLERLPIPNSITNTFDSEGNIVDILDTEPADLDNSIVRHVSTGIVLSETTAKSIYAWLGKQIEELESRKAVTDSSEKGQ